MNPYYLTDKKVRSNIGIQSPIDPKNDSNNAYAIISNQKILIMDREILNKEYVSKKTIRVNFENFNKEVRIEIIRISECPNDESEYDHDKPTVSVLIGWKEKIPVDQPTLLPISGLVTQFDNHFIINPETNNQPSPPIAKPSKIIKVHISDFKKFDKEDATFYDISTSTEYANMPIVAVMDTGLKYKWGDDGQFERTFIKDKKQYKFIVAKAKNDCSNVGEFGYCGITEYLKTAAQNPLLVKLAGLAEPDILKSPYDDNKVDEIVGGENEQLNLEVGRHGTLISAILNQHGCKVLPVKVFAGGGWGTLFDILCGCNYVLSCKRSGTDIKVLNASFGGALNAEGCDLLYRKMKALNDAGIWVVAAAGNDGIDLDLPGNQRYPAQFGLANITGNSMGGLEKVITVNSAYDGTDRAGNFGQAVSLKVLSSIANGFPSAIPVRNNTPLEGTSFAAPYAAAVLAAGVATVANRAAAVAYIKANPIPGVVSFVTP